VKSKSLLITSTEQQSLDGSCNTYLLGTHHDKRIICLAPRQLIVALQMAIKVRSQV